MRYGRIAAFQNIQNRWRFIPSGMNSKRFCGCMWPEKSSDLTENMTLPGDGTIIFGFEYYSNDSDLKCFHGTVKLLRNLHCKVNIHCVNKSAGKGFFRVTWKIAVTSKRQGVSKDITASQEEKALKGKIPQTDPAWNKAGMDLKKETVERLRKPKSGTYWVRQTQSKWASDSSIRQRERNLMRVTNLGWWGAM